MDTQKDITRLIEEEIESSVLSGKIPPSTIELAEKLIRIK